MNVGRIMTMITGVLLIGSFGGGVQAGDAVAGKEKAMICASCHGENGISLLPQYPNLANQKEQYLVKQLSDFKAGKRTDPIMAGMAAPLSEADVQNLYSSLPPK
jgi:cytochrome c553